MTTDEKTETGQAQLQAEEEQAATAAEGETEATDETAEEGSDGDEAKDDAETEATDETDEETPEGPEWEDPDYDYTLKGMPTDVRPWKEIWEEQMAKVKQELADQGVPVVKAELLSGGDKGDGNDDEAKTDAETEEPPPVPDDAQVDDHGGAASEAPDGDSKEDKSSNEGDAQSE